MREQLLIGGTSSTGDPVDVRIASDGTIASVTTPASPTDRSADAAGAVGVEVVDVAGCVLLSAAVEPHAHLDKAFLAETIINPTGDLIGAVGAMRSNRHLLGVAETAERAERAARWMAANGYVAVRTHVDVTTEHGLTSVEALTDVRTRLADVIDVEIVALSGWPITGVAGADQRALTHAALDGGVDVLGGCPHLESVHGGTAEEATDVLLEIATDRAVAVDFHTDETLDETVAGLDHLARRVLEGFAHRVTASHCVSLDQQDDTTRAATIERVAAADISVVTLPHTNLFLQGRSRSPMPRGLTAVDDLIAAGVNVAAGADNLQDPFNPVGRACPFETAGLMIMASHRLPADAWELVSTAAAQVLDRPAGIAVRLPADLIAVAAGSVREAIAVGISPTYRWRAGRRTTPSTTDAAETNR